MSTKTSLMILFAVISLGVAIAGEMDYVTLTEGDVKGKNSFVNALNWSDGLAPHDDADYLVALGGETDSGGGLRTPANSSTSVTFGGRSLTIGIAGGAKGMLMQKAGNTAATIYPDLRLVNGDYSQGTEHNSKSSILLGNWTVLSGMDNPFSLIGSNDRYFYLAASLLGGENAALCVRHSVNETKGFFTVSLYGTNTAYNGKIVVEDPGVFLQVLGDNCPLGAPDSLSNSSAVVLRNQGGIRSETLDVPEIDPNKIFWVEQSGGRLFTDSGNTGALAVSFAGDGELEKVGLGRMVLGGSLANAGLRVSSGQLELSDTLSVGAGYPITVGRVAGTENSNAIADRGVLTGSETVLQRAAVTVVEGGLVVADSIGSTLALHSVDFTGGGVMALIDPATGDSSLVELDEECAVQWPLALSLSENFPGSTGPDSYTVVKIPVTLKTVTADDFVNTTPGSESGFPKTEITVETRDDGFQYVSIHRTVSVIEMVKFGDTNYYFATASVWSDNQPAHSDADYLVNAASGAKALRTGDANLQTVFFPGTSLTCVGNSAGAASLIVKSETLTIDDLRMYDYTKIGIAGYKNSTDCTQNILGHIKVFATSQGPLQITNEKNRTLGLYADLEGGADARISIYPSNSDNGIRHHDFYGNNTNYFGAIALNQRGKGTPSLTKYQEISIANETNLGGNPPTYNYECLRLSYYSRLVARESLVIDDPNRGIMFEGASQLAVGENDTLTILSPLNFFGKVYKQGLGLLALGAPIHFGETGESETPSGDDNLLLVTEGSLQALTGSALSGLSVDFDWNTKLVIAPESGDALLREKGVVNLADTPFSWPEEGKLNVKLDYETTRRGNYDVPLLTVTATAAETLRGNIELEAFRRNFAIELMDRETDDGVLFYAHYTDNTATMLFIH